MATAPAATRSAQLSRALRLEYVTVGWNLAEGVIAVSAALASGSVALLAFGADSFVESTSGSVLIWRLLAERRTADHARIEHLAQRLVAGTLVGLALFVAADATRSLWQRDEPDNSTVGIVVLVVSLVVMWWLARAKSRVAQQLGSRSMAADAFQTTACWWLSLVALAGLGLNAALDWWWADPVAALGVVVLLLREARETWRGEDCC